LELLALDGERLLHFHDHLGPVEHRVGAVDDLAARRLVGRIRKPRPDAGACLHQDAMAARGELAHRRWHQPYAIFVVLDLSGYADQHVAPRFDLPYRVSLALINAAIRAAARRRACRTRLKAPVARRARAAAQ